MYRKSTSMFGTLAAFAIVGLVFSFLAFQMVVTPSGMVTVMEDRPYFFGDEGVREMVLKPGRSIEWSSAFATKYYVVPIRLEQDFIDLPTSDTALLDFNTSIQVQIVDAFRLHSEFTENWAVNILYPPFTAMFRDITKKYTMTQILTSPTVAAEMEEALLKGLNAKMEAENVPVRITDFNLGQGRPNNEVVEQMNQTLAQQQAKKTYDEMDAAQKARLASEMSRAAADKAYADTLGYSPAQLIQMDFNQRFSEACAKSTCIIQGGSPAMPMALPMPAK